MSLTPNRQVTKRLRGLHSAPGRNPGGGKAFRVYPSRYRTTREETMNAFFQHHKHNIAFHYRCFDRLLLNATIQPFQQPERVIGFFWSYRQLYPVSRRVLRDIAAQYHNWVKYRAGKWGAPILDAPEEEK